jgi:hypothetical protein
LAKSEQKTDVRDVQGSRAGNDHRACSMTSYDGYDTREEMEKEIRDRGWGRFGV